ncbi:MAG TPA: (2Fe-2S)-binding protein [Armatimonadota bacterium]|nr:(2Fe-2S)-binding protein [Armatimonadota bacterium]
MAGTITLTINGSSRTVPVAPGQSLLIMLHDNLDMTGAKYGCGEGVCGACTVLMDGEVTRSCITPAEMAAGKSITTIEGLEQNGKLHPLQAAFMENGALQCGYCTSGMIMSGVALLRKTPHPTDAEIVRFMDGNVCRCGLHPHIIRAIRQVSEGGEHV